MKDISCIDHLSSVNLVTNVLTVAPDLPVGVRLHQFWEKWPAVGASPKVVRVLREGYTLSLSVLAKFDQVTNYHKLLCKSSQEPLFVAGIASAFEQKCCGTSTDSKI